MQAPRQTFVEQSFLKRKRVNFLTHNLMMNVTFLQLTSEMSVVESVNSYSCIGVL
jgi:hypothetical protein